MEPLTITRNFRAKTMPMSLKRSLWFGLRWCTSAALLVASWVVWLVLIAGLGLQVWVVTRRELELPDFALRAIERRLAASEITARFGRAIFDPTGRVLFEQVQLFGPDRTVPLVTIPRCVRQPGFPAAAGR